MAIGKRIVLFILTNLLVLVLVGVVFRMVGFSGYYTSTGGLDLVALLVFSGIFGFAGSFISLLLSKFIAKRAMRVQMIETPRNPTEEWILTATHRLADQAGVGRPEVGIFEGAPNAFATGWNRNNALVAVSTGLIQRMSKDEVEAVLAHEVAHVANGDMVTLALIQGVVNTFVIFMARIVGYFVDRVLLKNERGHGLGYWVSVIVAEIVFGLLASVVVMWFSRLREYRADAGAAELTSKEAMIGALRALGQSNEPEMPEQVAAFGINAKGGLLALLRSHPPIVDRIRALGG